MNNTPSSSALGPAVRALILITADALLQAEPGYWRRRGREFEGARPRPGDYTGRLDPHQLAAIDKRIAAKAQACRNHAQLLESTFEDRQADTVLEVVDVMLSHREAKKAEDAA